MSAPAPLCRYCGKPIGKETRIVYPVLELTKYMRNNNTQFIRYLVVPAFPKSKAECQALTNWTVVATKWAEVYDDDHVLSKPYIRIFHEWDGSSYKDEYFCNGAHAKSFGYVMACAGYGTQSFNKALREQQNERSAA